VLGPFEVQQRPLTLAAHEAKPPDGLAAWWKLDESEGASAADASGHGLAARAQGRFHWGPGQGRSGGALQLDGPAGWVDCGGIDEFNFRDAMTFSVWVKAPKGEKLSSSLLTKGNNTWRIQAAADRRAVSFSLTGPLTTGTNRGRAPIVKTKRPLDDGQWHHLAGVYDGKRVALFLDGELEEAVSATGPIAVNTEPVLVGQNSMGQTQSFKGWIDELRLYGRALSDPEIKALSRGDTL
jgi:large repetitive protein